MEKKNIFLNQDDSAFTRCHPVADMTIAGLEQMVDFYAQGQQLGGLAFCVNMQRALFSSKAWETFFDEKPATAGEGQAARIQVGEVVGTAALRAKGIDQFEVWLNRARHHGLEAFLSMRMNDCHGLESHGSFNRQNRGADQDHYHGHATEFWKANRHLRRAPYRFECSFEGAFDYSHEEVRKHHLGLVAELFDRYDMDGLEMDWMRWMFLFAPGKEAEGRDILTSFNSAVNSLRKAAEKRLGHPIQLRHRIPAEPQTCFALGYDVAAWAEYGFADQIILSSFGGVANFNYSVELWRRLVGHRVRILALVESVASAYPGAGTTMNYHFAFGAASSALQQGADGIYLFNECYREAGGPNERRLLLQMLNSIGSSSTLNRLVRRHPITYPQVRAPGDSLRALLPIPLQNPAPGTDPGRWAENITLRLHVGSKPVMAEFILRLGFSEDADLHLLRQMNVRVNGSIVQAAADPVYTDCMQEAFPKQKYQPSPANSHGFLHFRIPSKHVRDGVNIVEFEPAAAPGRLEWAEILVFPVSDSKIDLLADVDSTSRGL